MMANIFKIIVAIFLTANICESKVGKFNIYIVKAAEIEALNAVEQGIKDYLGDKKYNFETEVCQANSALGEQIISKIANKNDKNSVVVSIGTLPSQIAYKFAKRKKIKLIFTAVTDPYSITKSFENSNTTGLSDSVPLEPQINLIKDINQKLINIGVIYNAGELNSVVELKKLKDLAIKMKIKIIEQSIQKTSDIPAAIDSIISKVDAIFINNDNTALSGISVIVKACNKSKIPVFASDIDEVKKGCVAAIGPNQYKLGQQTGQIIEKVKNGENINEIKIKYPESTEIFINKKAAKDLGLDIPKEVLEKADKIAE